MASRSLTCFVVLACLAAPAPAQDSIAWRERTQVERMSDRDLERLVLRCSREAGERLLDVGDAALCSIGFEALKQRRFGGDFDALLAWWRGRATGTPPAPSSPRRRGSRRCRHFLDPRLRGDDGGGVRAVPR